jgi:hypothetical protein
VVIAEDNYFAAAEFEGALTDAGYEVVDVAVSAAEATVRESLWPAPIRSCRASRGITSRFVR